MGGVAEETDVLVGGEPGGKGFAADEFPVDAGGRAFDLLSHKRSVFV